MRAFLRSLNDILTTAVLWVVPIYSLSKVVGSGTWRWSVIIVGAACVALVINRLIVFLYTKFAPDRLRDRTTHLLAKPEIATNGTASRESLR
jgi:hypothetical protein